MCTLPGTRSTTSHFGLCKSCPFYIIWGGGPHSYCTLIFDHMRNLYIYNACTYMHFISPMLMFRLGQRGIACLPVASLCIAKQKSLVSSRRGWQYTDRSFKDILRTFSSGYLHFCHSLGSPLGFAR